MDNINNHDDEFRVLGGSEWNGEEVSLIEELGEEQPPQPWYKRRETKWAVIALFVMALVAGSVWWVTQWYLRSKYYKEFDYTYSRTSQQVIDALESSQPIKDYRRGGVTCMEDSINNVHFNVYTLTGLTASVELEYPSAKDRSVYFVTPTMDYRKNDSLSLGERSYIGDALVADSIYGTGRHRAGFIATIPGSTAIIGVSREDSVLNYLRTVPAENINGRMTSTSFVRQIALLSHSEICVSQLDLKGKWERCAYCYKEETPDIVYFVESLTKESLYDFSEALRDYGFSDAVYVSGGLVENRFYRLSKNRIHGELGTAGPDLYLVFRRKK